MPNVHFHNALKCKENAQYRQAISELETGLRLSKSLKDHKCAIACKNELGDCLRRIGEYEKALRILKETKREIESIPDISGVQAINNLNYTGICLIFLGKPENAHSKFAAALQLAKNLNPKPLPETADVYYSIGFFNFKQGKLKAAKTNYQKALEIRKAYYKKAHADLGRSHNSLGTCHRAAGHYLAALDCYKQSLAIYKQTLPNTHPDLSMCYSNIGNCHVQGGDYDNALPYYKKALHLRLKTFGENHLYVAQTYSNMGTCLSDGGRHEEALPYFENALAIKSEIYGKAHYTLGQLHNNIGICYKRAGTYETARSHFQIAINLMTNAQKSEHPEMAHYHVNIGNCHSILEQYEQAEKAYLKALEIGKRSLNEHHPVIAKTHAFLGNLKFEFRQYDAALQAYQNALDVLLPDAASAFSTFKSTDFPDVQTCREPNILLATLEAKANCMFRQYITERKDLSFLKSTFSAYFKLDEWVNHLRNGYKAEGSKMLLAEKAHKIYENAIEVTHKLSRAANQPDLLAHALEFSEKCKAIVLLSNRNEELAKVNAQIPSHLLQKERELQSKLTFLDKQITDETYKNKVDKAKLSEWESMRFDYGQQYQKLIGELERNYPEYHYLKYNVQSLSLTQCQAALDENTLVLEYFVGEDLLHIFAVSKRAFKVCTLQKPDDFEDLVNDYLFAIEERSKYEYAELAFELHELLVAPVFSQLDVSAFSSIKIIPDGILSTIPFEALLCSETPENTPYAHMPYLISHYNISYHFSLTLWWHYRQHAGGKSTQSAFVGFAPVYENDNAHLSSTRAASPPPGKSGKRYAELPHSKEEVEKVQNAFKNKQLKGEVFLHHRASVANFVRHAKNARHVLVSAHADYNYEKPELTGIVFSASEVDNPSNTAILRIADAYNLKMQTELLVLSCCETGVGKIAKGEGVMSLYRGFLSAGVKNIVHTLFKVYDKTSADLTIDFFNFILEEHACDEALRLSKKTIIERDVAPILWSGFLLIG